MLDPAASRRITANFAIVYPSLPWGRVEPSILCQFNRRGKFHPQSTCWNATRFLDFACAGLAWGLQSKALAQSHIDADLLVELAPEHSGRSAILDSTPSSCTSPAGHDRRREECRQTAPLTGSKVKKKTDRNQERKIR